MCAGRLEVIRREVWEDKCKGSGDELSPIYAVCLPIFIHHVHALHLQRSAFTVKIMLPLCEENVDGE